MGDIAGPDWLLVGDLISVGIVAAKPAVISSAIGGRDAVVNSAGVIDLLSGLPNVSGNQNRIEIGAFGGGNDLFRRRFFLRYQGMACLNPDPKTAQRPAKVVFKLYPCSLLLGDTDDQYTFQIQLGQFWIDIAVGNFRVSSARGQNQKSHTD